MRAVLTIAGSDSGGGAGIQADLNTFKDFGAHGTSAITAVTAQNTCGVRGVHFIPPAFVGQQIDAVATDINIKAVKLGMLGNSDITLETAQKLQQHNLTGNLVLDPVMVSASGDVLLEDTAIKLYRERLLPLARVLTPNLQEASLLAGMEVNTLQQMEKAAVTLHEMGAGLVFIKGGGGNEPQVTDILHNGEFHYLQARRLPGKYHGTGCTLSAAIAACLAREETTLQACKTAHRYLQEKLQAPYFPGTGAPLPGPA